MEKKKHMKVIRLLSLLLIVRASLMSTKRTTNLFYLWRDLEQSQAGSYVNALYNSAVRLFVLTPLLTLHHQDRVGVFTSALFITPCVHVLTPPQLSFSQLPSARHPPLLTFSPSPRSPTSKTSSFPLTPLIPLSIHHSLSLSCVTPPSLPPSRDNYYKPCEDQLVFKQLNKQGPGLLTVAIQHWSETLE